MLFGLELFDFLFIAAGAIVAGYAFSVWDSVWNWLKAQRKGPPPAKWQVRFIDPDGIPTRIDTMSAKSVGRLIENINRGIYD